MEHNHRVVSLRSSPPPVFYPMFWISSIRVECATALVRGNWLLSIDHWFGKGRQIPGMKVGGGWRRFLFLLPVMIFLPYLLSGNCLQLLFRSNVWDFIKLCKWFSFIFFGWAVLELHNFSTTVDQPKKHSKKSDHLVLAEAAGQGLRNRLQCQGKFDAIVLCVILQL